MLRTKIIDFAAVTGEVHTLSKKMVEMISFFFLISNKYALIKGKPKYTGSEQGKRNYKEKLQESRKSIKEGKD